VYGLSVATVHLNVFWSVFVSIKKKNAHFVQVGEGMGMGVGEYVGVGVGVS